MISKISSEREAAPDEQANLFLWYDAATAGHGVYGHVFVPVRLRSDIPGKITGLYRIFCRWEAVTLPTFFVVFHRFVEIYL